jgi:hypothetical protein
MLKLIAALLLITNMTLVRASSQDLALRLLEIFHVQEATDTAAQVMVNQIMATNESLLSHEAVFREFSRRYLGWNAVRDDIAKIYAREFSEQELKQLLQFFETPLGKKFIQTNPSLTGKVARHIQSVVQAHEEDLAQMIADDILGDAGLGEEK